MKATVKYLLAKIKAVKDNSKLRYVSIEKATQIAKQSADKKLDAMNEFRDSLKDQNENFVRKAEYQGQMLRMTDDIKSLRESRSFLEGKASITSVYIAYSIALLSLVISIIQIFIK
jgi:chromatin segregation and condensation protein Rec8/ScpA/Scc1 (kleisin family)